MARRNTYTSQQEREYNEKMSQSNSRGSEYKRERNFIIDIVIILVLVFVAYWIFEPVINKSSEKESQQVTNAQGEHVAVDFPIISEIMTSNKNAYPAVDGEYYDWVEIFNPTERAINLEGYGLSDKREDPGNFVFPTVILEPGQFTVVFLSGGAIEDSMHAAFKLSSAGETVYLFDTQQNQLDYVTVGHLSPNISYSRNLAILDNWEETEYYTPGFYNDETGWNTYLQTRRIYDSPLMINEVMSSNLITIADCDGEYNDWVEIINTGEEQMVLTGYALSDSVMEPRKWIFPYTVIEPGQLLVVFLSGKDKQDEDTQELHTDFKLNATEDNIILANQEGKILDHWLVQNMEDDKSMGRTFGSIENVEIYAHPTPGYENTEEGYNEFKKEDDIKNQSGLLISEVMNGNTNTLTDNFGDTPDWIELYNPTAERIEIGDYFLSDDPKNLKMWRFPEDFFIDPDEYLLIYASGQEEGGTRVHANFSISSDGEPVILSDIDGNILDVCVVASMPYDVSYGRTGQDMTFQYMPYATPGEANGLGWSSFTPDPRFMQEGGLYTEGSVIAIDVPEGAEVYYTIDCSEPSENSQLYQGPFQIFKTTVLKAVAYADGKLESNVVTATYFVGIEHDLPIVSITSDPVNLFSDHAGIYAYGTDYDKKHMPIAGANFHEDWEVPAHLEMYEIDGSQAMDQGIGLRIFGAFSRAELKKSFAIIARNEYGASVLDYPIFPSLPYDSYKSVVLRSGASEWYSSMIRDSLLTSLAADTTDLDVQAYYPVVVYLNGEYWGVYFFREKLNKYYVEQHHPGIDPDNLDIIYGNGTSSRHAVNGTNDNWLELREYVKTHDLSDPEVYKVVTDWVDVDNYMDMVINEIYVGNQDTGNIKCYRENVEGAKWRWFYYDVDWGFFYTDQANVLTNNLKGYINEEGHGAGDGFETWLIMGLLDNPDFKRAFIERFAYHIKITYNPTRVIERINEIYEVLDPEMPQDREHWDEICEDSPDWYKAIASRGMSYKSWSTSQKERLIDFANQRPTVMQSQLVDFFDIDPEWEAELFS